MPSPETIAAYDAMPLGVAVVGEDLEVLVWNRTLSRWSEITPEAALGKRLPELFPGLDLVRYSQAFASVIQQNQSIVFSTAMHQRFLPLKSGDGKPMSTPSSATTRTSRRVRRRRRSR